MSKFLEDLRGESVAIQIRNYPYIGIQGFPMEVLMTNEGFATVPILMGTVVDFDEKHLRLETTDPSGKEDNSVMILLPLTDLGPITVIRPRSILL